MHLGSARAKHARAWRLFEQLNEDVGEWQTSDAIEWFHERNDEATQFITGVRFTSPPPLLGWSLLTGDIIHNTRCALDHAVYAAAVDVSGESPPPHQRRLAYPIVDEGGGWASAAGRCLPGLGAIEDHIKAQQPFATGRTSLSRLRDLSNTDKHRVVEVSLFSLAGADAAFGSLIPGSECTVKLRDSALSVAEPNWIVALETDTPHPDGIEADLGLKLRLSFSEEAGTGPSRLAAFDGATGDALVEIPERHSPGGGPSMVDLLHTMWREVESVLEAFENI